jgi:hypothetical protein
MRWLMTVLCLLSASAFGYSASERIRHMEEAFRVVLPHTVRVNQKPVVSEAFRGKFETRRDLQPALLVDYLTQHPNELVAVRNYLQQLIDAGWMQSETAVQILDQATHKIGMPIPSS